MVATIGPQLLVGKLAQGWKVKPSNLCFLVEEAAEFIQAFDRCDATKVPRAEIVRVLGHSTDQAVCQPARTLVDTYTHTWHTWPQRTVPMTTIIGTAQGLLTKRGGRYLEAENHQPQSARMLLPQCSRIPRRAIRGVPGSADYAHGSGP